MKNFYETFKRKQIEKSFKKLQECTNEQLEKKIQDWRKYEYDQEFFKDHFGLGDLMLTGFTSSVGMIFGFLVADARASLSMHNTTTNFLNTLDASQLNHYFDLTNTHTVENLAVYLNNGNDAISALISHESGLSNVLNEMMVNYIVTYEIFTVGLCAAITLVPHFYYNHKFYKTQKLQETAFKARDILTKRAQEYSLFPYE